MNKPENDESSMENFTSDSESDSLNSDEEGLAEEEDLEDTDSDSDTDLPSDGVIGEDNLPFRFIFGEEAQARSLDGIAYGIGENGQFFVIGKDGDTISGMLVHALIERNIKDGVLRPIVSSVDSPSVAKMSTES